MVVDNIHLGSKPLHPSIKLFGHEISESYASLQS